MKQTILIRDVQLVQGGISPRCDMLIQDGVIAKLGKDLNLPTLSLTAPA